MSEARYLKFGLGIVNRKYWHMLVTLPQYGGLHTHTHTRLTALFPGLPG